MELFSEFPLSYPRRKQQSLSLFPFPFLFRLINKTIIGMEAHSFDIWDIYLENIVTSILFCFYSTQEKSLSL